MASNHGVIVNVGSVAGLQGAPMMSHYGRRKAIASLTRSVALEQPIKVSASTRWCLAGSKPTSPIFFASTRNRVVGAEPSAVGPLRTQ